MTTPLSVATEECKVVWEAGNLAAIDRFYDAAFVDHDPIPQLPPGREGLKLFVGMLCEAFGDRTFTVDVVFADGERVARRWTMTATHRAPFLGVPTTNKQVRMSGIDLLRIHDGKIVEIWHTEDVAGLMQQIAPPPR